MFQLWVSRPFFLNGIKKEQFYQLININNVSIKDFCFPQILQPMSKVRFILWLQESINVEMSKTGPTKGVCKACLGVIMEKEERNST